MTVTTEKADDDIDALDALESEEREFIKVINAAPPNFPAPKYIC